MFTASDRQEIRDLAIGEVRSRVPQAALAAMGTRVPVDLLTDDFLGQMVDAHLDVIQKGFAPQVGEGPQRAVSPGTAAVVGMAVAIFLRSILPPLLADLAHTPPAPAPAVETSAFGGHPIPSQMAPSLSPSSTASGAPAPAPVRRDEELQP